MSLDKNFSKKIVDSKNNDQENFQIKLNNEIKNLKHIAIFVIVLVLSVILKNKTQSIK